MSPLAALRSHRSVDDLPPAPTDEELLAWCESPLAPASRPPRIEPLRAAGVATRVATPDGPVRVKDLLAEIEKRTATLSAVTA